MESVKWQLRKQSNISKPELTNFSPPKIAIQEGLAAPPPLCCGFARGNGDEGGTPRGLRAVQEEGEAILLMRT
jgi:hypothetical protein